MQTRVENSAAGAEQKMHICYQMNCTYREPWHGETFIIPFVYFGKCSSIMKKFPMKHIFFYFFQIKCNEVSLEYS